MNLYVYETNQKLDQSAAGIIAGMLRTNPKTVLGMATGSTPIGIYEELVRLYQNGFVTFRQAVSFNLDEYAGLPEDHPENYITFMRKHLFDHIDLPAEQTHIPNGSASDLAAECARYDELIEQAGGIDIQILGLGLNGHIGFNEPGEFLTGGTHIAQLHEETRRSNARFFPSIDEVPTHALTMGIAGILKARTVMLVVRGSEKADIVHRALTGPITTALPASLLQTHPNLLVLLDEGAASKFQ